MVTLWLVRHGETDWNAQRRFQSRTDVPLNEVGRRQARRLAAELERRTYAGVWSSDLTRAKETAEIVYGPPTVDRRLREIDLGELEGRRWEDLDPEIQAALAAFAGFAAPGGERYDQFEARVLSFVDDLSPGEHLVVTHGGVIRLLRRVFGYEDLFPAPGSLTVLDVEG